VKLSLLHNNQLIAQYDIDSEDVVVGSEFLVGRAEDCHVVLDDRRISRYNAAFIVKEDAVYLKAMTDLGNISVNGVTLNDETKISDNDQITLYDYIIKVDAVEQIHHFENQLKELPEDDLPSAVMEMDSTEMLDEPVAEEVLEPAPVEDDTFSPVEPESGTDAALEAQISEEVEDELVMDTDLSEEPAEDLSADVGGDDLSLEGEEASAGDDDFLADESPMDDFMAEGDSSEESGDESPMDDFMAEDDSSDDSAEEEDPFGGGDEFSTDEEDDGFGGDDDGFGDDDDGGFGNVDDGGFGDDGGGGDGDSTQMITGFARFVILLDGPAAPFDRYEITEAETFIGRDPEKCKIVLNDSEVSGVHAVIRKSLINCTLEDLNSSNGTVYKGSRINKADLSNGDEFEIGGTIFTFMVDSDQVGKGVDALMPVDDEMEMEIEDVIDMDELDDDLDLDFSDGPAPAPGLKGLLQDPKKKKLVYGALALILIVLFMEDDKPKTPKKDKAKTAKTKNLKKDTKPKKVLSPEIIQELEKKLYACY
jgi:pSer/pThr/pTyr-binding forkhead associated (FHA) protein